MQKNSSTENKSPTKTAPAGSDAPEQWSLTILGKIAEIDSAEWDRLNHADNPFVSHGFLHTLEVTECVGANSGWEPMHVCLRDENEQLRAAMPMYVKTNSSGEFVFDWSWASAYEQHGLSYYPKLVVAVPFSPVPGPRFLMDHQVDFEKTADALLGCAIAAAKEFKASSIHILFAEEREVKHAEKRGFLFRQDCQFVWRNQGFETFEDFTATLRSSKRKKLNR
ncbi:MAG: peptidogalycan biosysnthesis protein, partial [Pseudomonadota bacterium]